VGGILSLRLTYTGVVLIASGAVLAGAELLSPSSLRSRTFWIALGITYIPFMIANGILTGLPVVIYDDSRNLGIRVGSIPVEDFFFSFAMLVASFIAFDGFESRRGRVSEPSPAQLESGRPRGAGDAP
jgi:lycopene cyclase domain-containing protein